MVTVGLIMSKKSQGKETNIWKDKRMEMKMTIVARATIKRKGFPSPSQNITLSGPIVTGLPTNQRHLVLGRRTSQCQKS